MEQRLTIFAQLTLAAIFSVVVTAQLAPHITRQVEEEPTRTDAILDSRLNGQQLQVRPASGQPAPLDIPLQSSRNQSDQDAQGDLQTPQEDIQKQQKQSLQPNAGIDDLPEGYDF